MMTSRILLLIPLLLLGACNDVPTHSSNLFPYPRAENQLVPLAIGNRWSYRNMLTGETEVPAGPYFISEITGFVEDKTWTSYSYFTHGDAAYGVTYDDLLFGTIRNGAVTAPYLLPHNPIVGGTYSYDNSLICTGKEAVTVPAGTFHCYRFTLNGPRHLYWWSRGTGLIQQKSFGEQGELVAHWGLKSCVIKKYV